MPVSNGFSRKENTVSNGISREANIGIKRHFAGREHPGEAFAPGIKRKIAEKLRDKV
jgi:hypothetical protein